MNLLQKTLASFWLFSLTSLAADGDPKKGKQLYQVCIACHGANGQGNQALNAPNLVGLQDWYLIRQLKYFKEGIRGTHPKDTFGAQMRPIAMTLSNDKAITDVTAYITSLKSK